MKKFAKFWKAANFRLKFGLIVTLIFFIIGFVVYYVPHVNPFTFNTYPNKLGASAEHWLGTTSMGQDVVWLLARHRSHRGIPRHGCRCFCRSAFRFCRWPFRPRADDCYGYVRCYSVSADPHHDDLPDEGQLHHDRDGSCACHVRMGLAEPPDPFHGAEH